MRSRQVQNDPRSRWVWARSARWKACECASARPGMTNPRSRRELGCAVASVSIAVIEPSLTLNRTPSAVSSLDSRRRARRVHTTTRPSRRHPTAMTSASATAPLLQSLDSANSSRRVRHAQVGLRYEQHCGRHHRRQNALASWPWWAAPQCRRGGPAHVAAGAGGPAGNSTVSELTIRQAEFDALGGQACRASAVILSTSDRSVASSAAGVSARRSPTRESRWPRRGATMTLPNVATASWAAANDRAACTEDANASIGSCRSASRVAAAWFASPQNVHSLSARAARRRSDGDRRVDDRTPLPDAVVRRRRPRGCHAGRRRGVGLRPALSSSPHRGSHRGCPAARGLRGTPNAPVDSWKSDARHAEPRPLLVGERDDRARVPRRHAALANDVDGGEGGHHTELLVERAAVGHRIQVRAATNAPVGSPDQPGGIHHAHRLPLRSSSTSMPRWAAQPENDSRNVRSASMRSAGTRRGRYAGRCRESSARGCRSRGHAFPAFGIRTPRVAAMSAGVFVAGVARWRITPMPGSLVNTRASFCAASSVPSATVTWPAWT